MAPKPLALPNVTQATIAKQAYALFGAMAEEEAAKLNTAEVRKGVAEAGVDPGILADVMKEAKADPWSRMERDRTLGQYIAALKVPGLVVAEPDLLEAVEAPEETEDEREAREYSEGFWAYLTHIVPNEPQEHSGPFLRGWHEANKTVHGE